MQHTSFKSSCENKDAQHQCWEAKQCNIYPRDKGGEVVLLGEKRYCKIFWYYSNNNQQISSNLFLWIFFLIRCFLLLFEMRFIYSVDHHSEQFPAFEQICHTLKQKNPSVETSTQRQNVKKPSSTYALP